MAYWDITAEPTSGGMTTAQLVARVRDLLGEETADLYADDEIVAALNEGKERLFSEVDALPVMVQESVVDGVSTYDLGLRMNIEWLALEGSTSNLEALRPEEAASIIVSGASGTPEGYIIVVGSTGNTAVRLLPQPSASYTMHGFGYRIPADLDLSGSNPTWHRQYVTVPCYYAASVLLQKDRRPEAANDMEARFRMGMREYATWLAKKQPYQPLVMEVKASPDFIM